MTQMSSYIQYAALAFGNTEPIWSEIYEDDSGLGNVTTVAVPVFDCNNILKAVVGHDIVATREVEEMVSQILNDIPKKRTCDPIGLSNDCQLQVWSIWEQEHCENLELCG